MTHRLVDTDPLGTAVGIQEHLATLRATLVFILADIGQVRNTFVRGSPVGSVVGNDGNATLDGPQQRLLEQDPIGHRDDQDVRVGGERLVDILGRLFRIEPVGGNEGNVNVQVSGCIFVALLFDTPEGVPRTGPVRHDVNVDGRLPGVLSLLR